MLQKLLAHPQEKVNERALKMACEAILSDEFVHRIEGVVFWLVPLLPQQQQELIDRQNF